MKQKAFVIVEAEICEQCKRVRLLYKGRCDCQDAKCDALGHKMQSKDDRWEELKTWLKKHPNQIHYMGAATIESVVRKMEELEKI